jgi:nucleoside phosphorylase
LHETKLLAIHGDVSIVNVRGDRNVVASNSPAAVIGAAPEEAPARARRTAPSAPHRAVIVTALPAEYAAVQKHLKALKEEVHPEGTVYEVGSFQGACKWSVAVVEAGKGNVNAALEARRAIDHFAPAVVFFAGVAGGLKDDMTLSDVVAATKVYGFEYGKAERTFKPRPEMHNASYSLEQRARALARTTDWRKRCKVSKANLKKFAALAAKKGSEFPPKAVVGPIAAGEKVVASTSSVTYKTLQSNFSDALAVEMEGYGFLHAVHIGKAILAMVIRGISDTIDNKAGVDKEGWQEIAAAYAAAFAFELLAKLDPDA